ncbi:hypothetical protein KJ567_05030 [Candidatus Bipolaricaulota bacterium]|nr:hypothetical protein [Candidatus Bipolaricaulota bacterium]
MNRKRLAGTLALLVSLSLASVAASSAPYATDYDIRVSLDPTTHSLVGSQTVRVANATDEPATTVTLALLANLGAQENPYIHPALLDDQYVAGFDPTWTRIAGVWDDAGDPLTYALQSVPPALQTYSLDDGLLVITLSAPLAPGAETTLQIEFETKFARALTLDNALHRGVYVWRFGWNPVVIDPPTDPLKFEIPAAVYRVELTVPEEIVVFGGADRQTAIQSEAGLTTVALESERPVRSIPLIMGEDLAAVTGEWNGIPIHAVYLPGHETFARLALTYAEEILADHSAHYGPFAPGRLVIAEGPGPGLYGMAADGMVLFGTDLAATRDIPVLGAYDRLAEYLLAHELAHLWWGIGIGADFNAENWISEGFAEYLSITYFEAKYGAFEPNLFAHLGEGLIEDVFRETFGYFNLRQHQSEASYLDLLKLRFDEPIVQPLVESEYLNGIVVRTYSKGYLVLRALSGLIGLQAMTDVLNEANAAWSGRVLTVDTFQELAERVSGMDLGPFFADWVHGNAQIDVSIDGFKTTEHDGAFTTTVRAEQHGSDLPILVEALLADGTTASVTWEADCCTAAVPPIETASPVVSIHLDPLEMLPDTNRFNNHWPRKILVDHPFRSEDAEPIGRPLDAYVLSIDPTGLSGSFRNDHQWTIAALPHIDTDATNVDIDEMLRTIDIVGAFAANISRELSFVAQGAWTGVDLLEGGGVIDVSLTLNARLFTHPETGNAGQYWYPTYQLGVTFGLLGDVAQPTPYLDLAFSQSALLDCYMTNAVQFIAGVPGFGSDPFALIGARTVKRFRLAHLLYVDVTASAALSLLDTLPSEFALSPDALHALADPPMGTRQSIVGTELILPPLARDLDYAILNLTRLQRIAPSLFVIGSATWVDSSSVDPALRAECGGKLMLQFAGFLGAPIEIGLGVAVPLLGPDTEAMPFLDLSGSF